MIDKNLLSLGSLVEASGVEGKVTGIGEFISINGNPYKEEDLKGIWLDPIKVSEIGFTSRCLQKMDGKIEDEVKEVSGHIISLSSKHDYYNRGEWYMTITDLNKGMERCTAYVSFIHELQAYVKQVTGSDIF